MPAASRRTRRILAAVLVPAAVVTVLALVLLWPGSVRDGSGDPGTGGGQRALGTVSAVAERVCPAGSAQRRCGSATVQVTEGPGAGSRQEVDLPQGPGTTTLRPGDDVVLLHFPGAVPGGRAYSVVDRQRATPMIWLVGLAVAVILAFGRRRGVTSLAGLAVSFGVLLFFVVPAVLDGSPPLLVAVVGASAIMFAALYLTHGVNVHTSLAVAGTLASLVLTGVLGAVFTSAMHLTGTGSDDSAYLSVTRAGLDLRGLLLAGIVIGALGVLDDVTVTQAVTVAEMAPGATGRWELFQAAIRVGRAHVASAVNTIVLAYAGASLPLLLLIAAGSEPIGDLLTSEFLAQEILRSAVGTIGLVASVPITTGLAALVAELGATPARAVRPDGTARRARHRG
ncbi:YibE/F family protein [Couchioplanes caeruleus]|uniref:YibE/F family protein n=2 Tax=Couchioplanes caeruleus TaxID=56438 RepID=A0A1K0GID7_9ACTN|nr:YibE/F family protein [Couchioplanes caeruleus]OJF12006.1 YibE/F family protein [Couchioplanes caeruleus subsp. caeruleus]ROP27369.1 putative membrane protein [Couchioplanes caeruleus]